MLLGINDFSTSFIVTGDCFFSERPDTAASNKSWVSFIFSSIIDIKLPSIIIDLISSIFSLNLLIPSLTGQVCVASSYVIGDNPASIWSLNSWVRSESLNSVSYTSNKKSSSVNMLLLPRNTVLSLL